MSRMFYFFILVVSSSLLIAAQATQTDWSDGPGVWGPVVNWDQDFYRQEGILWRNSGTIELLPAMEYSVDNNFFNSKSVLVEDINGDGYLDIVGGAFVDSNTVIWWENTDGTGTSWIEHVIAPAFDGAWLIDAADINDDGYMDVLGAAFYDGEFTWWENSDGTGTSWIEHTIESGHDAAISVSAADIDGDGDMDVTAATHSEYSTDYNDLIWYENENGSGTLWTMHYVGQSGGADCVSCSDINGDGDMDILIVAYYDQVSWWENVDSVGTSWVKHVLTCSSVACLSAQAADIDGDGFLDIVAGRHYEDIVAWYRNEDGTGTSWTEHQIETEFQSPNCVYATDMNGDGYTDVIAAGSGDDLVVWWENTDGTGLNWTKNTVDNDFEYAYSVCAGDINGDSSPDIIGSAIGGSVSWWDITEYFTDGYLESTCLHVSEEPAWSYIDWTAEVPDGAELTFQVRSSGSPDSTSMGEWSDVIYHPQTLQGILNDGDNYMQYRVLLSYDFFVATATLYDLTITWNPVSIGTPEDIYIAGISSLEVSPNPVTGSGAINYTVPELSDIRITFFSLSGRIVRSIEFEACCAGVHSMVIDDLTPGMYFCRMESTGFDETVRFIVIE